MDCVRCGFDIALPSVGDALLDERGLAHVACPYCSAENLADMGLPPPMIPKSRPRFNGWPLEVALLLWALIIAMALLLLPVYQIAPSPEPERVSPALFT